SQQLAQRANLQVISKKEWTSYKNRYLKLRKKSATIAKKYLNAVAEKNRSSAADKHDGLQHEQARKGRRQNNRGGGQSVDPDSEHTAKKARQIDEKEQKGNDSLDEKPNGNLRTTKQVDEPTTAQENELIVQGQNEAGEEMKKFTKGCIIKIEARKGLLRTDKALMRSIPGVAFVDMIENDPVAFVRFNNPEEAEIFAASHSGSGSNQQNGENEQKINQGDDVPKQEVGDMLDNLGVKHCSVLRDEEEVNYWQRVELMRGRKKQSSSTAKKYKNNASRNQTDAQSKSNRKSRGKQRLKEKYEKYTHEVDKQIEVRMNKRIVFDD
ncbi:la-related protein 7-like, partial [Tropilaelaps mercedesae]